MVGLARSGAAIARLLVARGERVLGCDAGRPREAEGLAASGVETSLDVDGTGLLEDVGTLVKSPGVPRSAPVVQAAHERGIEVAGELELAWRLIPNYFCAVTGTNGKTTTSELIGHLLDCDGRSVEVAGNVGTPLASLASPGRLEPETTVVCEVSSFQLEDCSEFAPECAVFLNLAPDHLDRHGTMERYLAAKLRIFARQGPEDVSVLNGDEPALADAELPGDAQRLRFCPTGAGPHQCATTLERGEVRWRGDPLIAAEEIPLLGAHNVENAMAAATAALAMGVDTDAVVRGIRSFEGVPHRLERVRERGGVLYVNDSKATNVGAAIAGVEAFSGGVHLIAGGSLKGERFEALAAPVAGRCRACYLIGEAAGELAEDLAAAADAGVRVLACETLEAAVAAASQAALPGEVVLLSPACASFDAFEDFEQRGARFRELVEALA